MNLQTVMDELEKSGTAQTRKTYARHGIPEPMFGVSYATLGAMTKKIKMDHALALALWETGNHDARVLATMIADPGQMDVKFIESWGRGLDHALTFALSKLAAQAGLGRKAIDKWCAAKDEWAGQLGWSLVGALAMNETGADVDDEYFLEKLHTIETGIHQARNWVRYTMNGALIAIGARNAALRKAALAAAKRIGQVEVDHGDTDCKTPDAATYIEKMAARRRARKQKARVWKM